jgi:hypothetical protein
MIKNVDDYLGFLSIYFAANQTKQVVLAEARKQGQGRRSIARVCKTIGDFNIQLLAFVNVMEYNSTHWK